MKPKRILLAEDNPNDVELMLTALEEHSLANDVVVVRDGRDTLDYLYRMGRFSERPAGHPAVVFLDLKMPKLDGLEVLRQVKSDPAVKSVPIVVFSSSSQDQDIAVSYNLGANAYVVKPVDFDEFTHVVKQLSLFWVSINRPPQTF